MLNHSNINFKIDKSKIEGIKDLKNDIFPSHFLGVLCGKPGSGKTTLLRFILKSEDLLFKKFDFIFIISPSFIEFRALFLPKTNFNKELDWEWIYIKINQINKLFNKIYTNVLFIFDDVITDINKSVREGSFMKFIFNRRVFLYNFSIYLTMV